MDRRLFIRQTAMSLATAAAGGLGDSSQAASQDAALTWNKAPCRFCGTGCHVQVGVKDQRVVAIAGDQQAEVNRGLLCVKGYHVGLALYGKDRLTHPLLRQGSEFKRISWEEAIERVAERVLQGPQGFALYGSGQWTIPEGYAAQKFIKAGLANNQIEPNARLCMASAVTGFLSTYGVDEPAGCYDDLDRCDVCILWGNNPAEMHPVLFSRMIDRRSRGEKVMLIDMGTRTTRSTSFADHHLLFKPNTDLAIANCIAQQLVARGTYAKDFVGKFCNFRADSDTPELNGKAIDFEQFAQLVAQYTPQYVSQLSGVPEFQLVMLADLFSDRQLRITSTWCMGMNQHTRGTAINSLVHGVHLLSGHFGRPGDAPMSLTGQPSACGTVREVGTLAHALPGGLLLADDEHRKHAEEIWNLPTGRIRKAPGHHTVEMWKRFCTPTAEGGDVHTIWVQVTNPGQTLPNLDQLFTPSRKLADKFLIVSDVYPTATTRMADLILPSAMWVEKNGMTGNSERRTQQWFKMVPPPGQARDDAWQIISVARKLYDRGFEGMRDKDGQFLFSIRRDGKELPIWDFEHYYDVNVDEHLFEEYRRFSRFKHKDLAPYAQYVQARGLRWPVVQQANGSWRETKFRFSGFDDPYVSPGAEFDFYHSTTHDGRAQIWFRPYEPPPEVPDEQYPFWLCTGRVLEHWHSGSMTQRIPPLHNAVPNAYVEIHAADAQRLGVHSGERVRLETRRGALELAAWVGGRGEPAEGSVFVPFFDENLLINRLTLEAFDPFSKQPDYKKCSARVSKV
jgi:nitrate reductase NapA